MALSRIKPATKTEGIKYAIRDIITLAEEVAQSGKDMIYLNIGDPNVYDFSTPQHLIDAVSEAMNLNRNGYSPSSGIPQAINAINEDAKKKGITNIIDTFITTGAAEAIDISLTALLNKGDNFLMPTPGYPLYTAVQSKLECEPNPYYLDEDNGWQPDVDDIRSKVNDRTKAIVLINPNNPTGRTCSKEVLEGIIDIAVEHNLVILADEIYDKLIFDDGEMISIASLNPDANCITFSGMSKNFMAPGWRIGWGVASGQNKFMGDYLEAINKILRSRVSANHPMQFAIEPALLGKQSHLRNNIKKLQERVEIIDKAIKNTPRISLVKPQASFYAFPKIEVKDDWHFAKELLRKTGVVVVPGAGFGQKPGTNHFRIVFCASEEALKMSFECIADFMKSYKG